MRMRWRYAPAAALLAVMAVVLARSEETAQAVRDGLALCAQSVVPALFPFFVLSGLFISMGCAGVLAPALGRLPGVSPAGASACRKKQQRSSKERILTFSSAADR